MLKLSYSQIEHFLQCPRKWQYESIQGIYEPDGGPDDAREVGKRVADEIDGVWKSKIQRTDCRESMSIKGLNWMNSFLPEFNGKTEVWCEWDSGLGWKLRGKADFIRGNFACVDFKTGKIETKNVFTDLQALCYLAMIPSLRLFGWVYLKADPADKRFQQITKIDNTIDWRQRFLDRYGRTCEAMVKYSQTPIEQVPVNTSTQCKFWNRTCHVESRCSKNVEVGF